MIDLRESAEKMEKKYFKREKNRSIFLVNQKENKRLYSGIKSVNKKIVKMTKEKIEISNKIYEDVCFFVFLGKNYFFFFFKFLKIEKNIEMMDDRLKRTEEELNKTLTQILAEKENLKLDSFNIRKSTKEMFHYFQTNKEKEKRRKL